MSSTSQLSGHPTKEYTGGCHCQKFRYKFSWNDAPFEDGSHNVNCCNCSICQMKGFIYVPLPEESFKFTSGSMEELTLYEFNKKTYTHHFCPVCGIEILVGAKGLEKPMVGVNVRSVDGIDVQKLKFNYSNGRAL